MLSGSYKRTTTMLNNYIIGLVPEAHKSHEYFEASKKLCAANNAGYLLSPAKSLPHITICQVVTSDVKVIEEIWDLNKNFTFTPAFYGFHIIPEIEKDAETYWLELSVRRDAPLLSMHQKIKHLLAQRELVCVNPCDDHYRPHLTLGGVNSLKDLSMQDYPLHLLKETELFFLMAAKADANWQCNQFIL